MTNANVPGPTRDRWLAGLLRKAGLANGSTPDERAALARRIMLAAAPLLEQRTASPAGVWDDLERWAGMLIPVGTFTALAAGVCLFWLSTRASAPLPVAVEQTALLGAATNAVSSHDLIDLLVTSDAGGVRGGGR
jgi:hypothetical protein